MLTWALPGNAKGIYDLVERGNTSFGFTYVHRVRAVGQFENEQSTAKHETAALEWRAAVLRWRKTALARRRGIAPTEGVQRSRGDST